MRPGGLALAMALILAAPAVRADAIDGDWCSPGQIRTLSIDGPRILTPGRQETEGTYSRHAFSYVVPEGEAGAGQDVLMQLINEQEMMVASGNAAPETWRRCDLSS